MQYYDINITAGTSRNIDAAGDYFYYYAGSAGGADSSITVKEDQRGTSIILKPGQGFKMEKGQTANMWRITNTVAGSSIIGNVVIGMGEIWDNRITGVVEIIDGGRAKTLAGTAFIGAVANNAVAAQNSMTQLWNPVASGKNLVLENLKFSGAAGAPIDMGSSSTALTSAGTSASTKLINSPINPVAQVRYQGSATPGAFISRYMTSSYMPTSQVQPYDFREPLVIPPGWGFVVINSTQNSNILVSFEWLEEPI